LDAKAAFLCDEFGIMLMADEVLTCMARTGKMFAMEHWDTVPDVMTLGKGLGNGFPVTAMLVAENTKNRSRRSAPAPHTAATRWPALRPWPASK
jgi:acetylornithine/succinyldiaminopimelate/putrescine aminotransferase